MAFVTATTLTAAAEMVTVWFPRLIDGGQVLKGVLNIALTVFVVVCVVLVLFLAVSRWLLVARGVIPIRPEKEKELPGSDLEGFREPGTPDTHVHEQA
jgi:hypothetical protein